MARHDGPSPRGWSLFRDWSMAAWNMIRMPGRSHRGPLPPADDELIQLAAELRRHVTHLAEEIGERNVQHRPKELARAADYIEAEGPPRLGTGANKESIKWLKKAAVLDPEYCESRCPICTRARGGNRIAKMFHSVEMLVTFGGCRKEGAEIVFHMGDESEFKALRNSTQTGSKRK